MRGRAIAGVVALCMLLPAFARASEVTADVTSRGSLVIRWTSNPDTCGGPGLCGRSGTLSWRPGRGSFDASTRGTQVTYFENPAVARSRRETDSGPRVCVEATDNLIELAATHAKGGSVLTMGKTPGLDVGRCAGPLPADFAGALPRSHPFSPSRLGRRGGTIDMRGRAPFAAGPFSGEVISSLQLRITPAPTEQTVSKMGARPARAARTRPPFSVVELGYAIERIDGQMVLGYVGTSDHVCEIFDVCGMNGEIAVGGNTTPGVIHVTTGRDLKRGQRETQATALRALRAGRMRSAFSASWFGEADNEYADPPVTARFDFTERSGSSADQQCFESGHFELDGLDVATTPGGLSVSVPRSEDGFPDELRTHCPGPEERELPSSLARGLLPWAALGDPEITVRLTPSDPFDSIAFSGRWSGQYDVALRRVSFEVTNRGPLRIP